MEERLIELAKKGDFPNLRELEEEGKISLQNVYDILRNYYYYGAYDGRFMMFWFNAYLKAIGPHRNSYDRAALRRFVVVAVREKAYDVMKKRMKLLTEEGLSPHRLDESLFHIVYRPDVLEFLFEKKCLNAGDMLACAIIGGDKKDATKWIAGFDAMAAEYTPSDLEPGLSGFLDKKSLIVLTKKCWEDSWWGDLERSSNVAGRLLARNRGLIFLSGMDRNTVDNKDLQAIIEKYNKEIWEVVTSEISE